ncbi:MAG TPA: RibD family protein [Lacunisphaera sp.]|jgi:riboflavin biosynthesis pyrimidine reductase
MKRPYVICHMMSTVDGRIKTERWSLSGAAERQYEAVHQLHRADAWLCGRETFQGDFLEQKRAANFSQKTKVPPGDFVADVQLPPTAPRKSRPVFAIAVDGSGKLHWESNDMRGDRLVVLTTAKAPSGYLADLRAKSISYVIGGKSEVDFAGALRRLHRYFGIRKVMLEGGGGINGALLAAGVVDEISLLICPFADGSRQLPTLFDVPKKLLGKKAAALKLTGVKRRPGEIVWLRYRVS